MKPQHGDLPEQQKDKTIRRTLEHTLGVIGEYGIEGVTTKRISKSMNMSTGILHHHFGTKDNIIYEAYMQFVEDIRVQALNLLKSDITPTRRLYKLGEMHFSELHSSPVGANLWLNFWHRSMDDKRVQRLLRIYHRRLLTNLVSTLLLIDPDRNWAQAAARSYFALMVGLWISLVLGGAISKKEEALGLLEQGLEGIITHKHKEMKA